jgi:hypothetical protein
MDSRQSRTLSSLVRVVGYLDHTPIVPEPPLVASMRRSLRASTKRIEALAAEQRSAKMDAKGNVAGRVRSLRRDRMMPLVRIAKPLLAFAPGAERVLHVPHARSDAYTIATAALHIADALAPHAKLLAAAGCSREYMREFRNEARDLALVSRRSEAARRRQRETTQRLAEEFRKAMKTVMVVEGLIMLHCGRDEVALVGWKHARRVTARLGRPKKRATPRREDTIST